MSEIITIPGPRGLPFIGNLLDLAGEEVPILALEHLADVYGPIFQITIKGRRTIVCSSAELIEELIDEKRFQKQPPPALAQSPGPKGLFGAANDDPDWGQAHRILTPAMGPLSIEGMFDGMDYLDFWVASSANMIRYEGHCKSACP
jgi:cytochrome P450/NADPH-cytochrome P450 reductase